MTKGPWAWKGHVERSFPQGLVEKGAQMGRGDNMWGTQVLNVYGHGLGRKVKWVTNRKMDSTKSA